MEARGPVLRLCQEALGGTSGGGTAAAGSGGGGGEAALAAVLLLGNLVARCPALLYEHTPKLKVCGYCGMCGWRHEGGAV